MVRWIAPILSFTADEIWRCMPGDRTAPVFTAEWYDALEELPADAELGRDFWQLLMQVKGEVNRELDLNLSEESGATTLAGAVIAEHGGIPSVGTWLSLKDGVQLEVVAADPRRVLRVRVHPAPETTDDTG